jgi:hypothetical protein
MALLLGKRNGAAAVALSVANSEGEPIFRQWPKRFKTILPAGHFFNFALDSRGGGGYIHSQAGACPPETTNLFVPSFDPSR